MRKRGEGKAGATRERYSDAMSDEGRTGGRVRDELDKGRRSRREEKGITEIVEKNEVKKRKERSGSR